MDVPGINVSQGSPGESAVVSGNTVTAETGGNGITVTSDNGATATVFGNTLTGNLGGMNVTSTNGANITASGNNVSGSTYAGISAWESSNNGAGATLTISGNLIWENPGGGVSLSCDCGGAVTFTGNTVIGIDHLVAR